MNIANSFSEMGKLDLALKAFKQAMDRDTWRRGLPVCAHSGWVGRPTRRSCQEGAEGLSRSPGRAHRRRDGAPATIRSRRDHEKVAMILDPSSNRPRVRQDVRAEYAHAGFCAPPAGPEARA